MKYYRTVEEFNAPFANSDSSVVKSGPRLRYTRIQSTSCPYQQAFEEADIAIWFSEYVVSLMSTMRSWSETVFLYALDSRYQATAQAIVDAFYQAFEA